MEPRILSSGEPGRWSPGLAAVLCAALGLIGCSFPAVAQTPLEIRFRAEVQGQPLACGKVYPGIGRARSAVTLKDFRFYVSGFRLVAADGSETPLALVPDGKWQSETTALLDFEDGSGPCRNGTPDMNDVVRAVAPAGKAFRGLRFSVGVPEAGNHADLTESAPPLDLVALFWSWNAGHKFIRLDIATKGLPQGAAFHIGSTGCALQSPGSSQPRPPCKSPNRPEIRLDPFDPASDLVVVDLASLLAGSDLEHNAPSSPVLCMSDPEDPDCAPIFHNLGLPFGQRPAGVQTFLRAERAAHKGP